MFKKIIFLFLALGISSCGDDNKDASLESGTSRLVDRKADSYEVTDKFGGLKIKEGEFTYNSETKPWSSWWFPSKERELFIDDTSEQLASKTNEAQESQDKVHLQAAMDNIRKNFSNEEADVYQQGDNLIIRLKKMDFRIGSAMVPSESAELLSKVNSAILKLNASKIIVEGHTDYTGNTNQNLSLSLKRSESVAQHLKSLGRSNYEISSKGYGETRPIANNQTQNGKAMNRRVDIVVDTSTKL